MSAWTTERSLDMLSEVGVAYCFEQCLAIPELVAMFNRLAGTNLGPDRRSPIIMEIDKATGYQKIRDEQFSNDVQKFVQFVRDDVWARLPNDAKWDIVAGLYGSPESQKQVPDKGE